jgi:hypothetical protein
MSLNIDGSEIGKWGEVNVCAQVTLHPAIRVRRNHGKHFSFESCMLHSVLIFSSSGQITGVMLHLFPGPQAHLQTTAHSLSLDMTRGRESKKTCLLPYERARSPVGKSIPFRAVRARSYNGIVATLQAFHSTSKLE